MRKVIRRQIRHRGDGLDLAVDVNAVIAIDRGGAQPGGSQGRDGTDEAASRVTAVSSSVEPDRGDQSSKEER